MRSSAIPAIKTHVLHNLVAAARGLSLGDFARLAIGIALARRRKLRLFLGEFLNNVLNLVGSGVCRLPFGGLQSHNAANQADKGSKALRKHDSSYSLLRRTQAGWPLRLSHL